MKDIFKSIRITIAFVLFLAIFYVLILWGYARIAGPGEKGNAELVQLNGKVVGAANVGQKFTSEYYFWGRPSACDYDGANSAGSNKGPSNPEYLAEVQTRIDSFLVSHPYLKKEDVPSEMVTASGSGLDPHISVQSAMVQVERVALARGVSSAQIREVVDSVTEKPLLSFLGPSKINVLKLNVALDEKFGVMK